MNYIGIPFKDNGRDENGLDCWGLVRLWYKNELNIDLPLLSGKYENTGEKKVIQEIISGQKTNWTKVGQPEFGDVIVFNITGFATHVGVYLGNQKFLHAFKGTQSCIEKLNGFRWSARIEGVYRYG